MSAFDRLFELATRGLAARTSRRGALARIGKAIALGGTLIPVLPVARGFAADDGNLPEEKCDYWKYCSVDGYLCSCCGGSTTQCPPGTEVSKVSWVGTCLNKTDGKHYLISYNDCCGKVSCGRCSCNNNVGERPGYQMGLHNDVDWCMGNASTIYNCTITLMLGEA
jgi:methylamine dehydrogenase light chain